MRVKVREVREWSLEGAYRLQALTEYVVGQLLEGRIQAGIVHGRWGASGWVVGLYQPALGGMGVVARRVTGGGMVYSQPQDYYLALVVPSTSLRALVDLARDYSECLGSGFLGVTRFGPRVLSAGVVEYIGGIDVSRAFECLQVFSRRPRVKRGSVDPARVDAIARAYGSARWIYYDGVSQLDRVGVVERNGFHVKVGVHLVEERYISTARIEGDFYAAPPAEPFSTIASIQGMPVGDQVLLALEARFGSVVELYGVTASDVVESARRALGLYDEEGSG